MRGCGHTRALHAEAEPTSLGRACTHRAPEVAGLRFVAEVVRALAHLCKFPEGKKDEKKEAPGAAKRDASGIGGMERQASGLDTHDEHNQQARAARCSARRIGRGGRPYRDCPKERKHGVCRTHDRPCVRTTTLRRVFPNFGRS